MTSIKLFFDDLTVVSDLIEPPHVEQDMLNARRQLTHFLNVKFSSNCRDTDDRLDDLDLISFI